MSQNPGLINTPNLKVCLSSSKTQDQSIQLGCLQTVSLKTKQICTQEVQTTHTMFSCALLSFEL